MTHTFAAPASGRIIAADGLSPTGFTGCLQFYNKVRAHENQHKSDYNNGFNGHVFIQADEYAEIVVGLTNATLEGLEAMLQKKIGDYVDTEHELMDSLQDVLEERAYAVSDPLSPFYVYQGVCEGY